MTAFARETSGALQGPLPFDEEHYRRVRRRNIFRLFFTYIAPLVLLTVYFFVQQSAIVSQSRNLHLKAIAENQASTLDLFLSERLVNLSNLIDDPRFRIPPTASAMQGYLETLKKNSPAFIDIGYFDSSGIQSAYAGPFPTLENRNYSSEEWYRKLEEPDTDHIITDIYLGFRQKPHFTMAVSRVIDGQFVVLRATLAPERIHEYISSLEGSHEVHASIVNKAGFYQIVTSHLGSPLEQSSVVPPENQQKGLEKASIGGRSTVYAFSWLQNTDWALIVQPSVENSATLFAGVPQTVVFIAAGFILLGLVVIVVRSSKLVEAQKEADRTRAQLGQAAKLASVGELAAGIAHEINNPLASISEEAGLLKDLLDPSFGESITREEIVEHLDSIHTSVFRCRDITRKLLRFVRQTEMNLKPHDVNQLLDGVVDGIVGPEMVVSNIEIVRHYDDNLPQLVTDGNQLQQVILNIINNAVDAIEGRPGRIILTTSSEDGQVVISLVDTGKGMSPNQLDKIFMPFFTTKEVGKGTGLGLSVSYGIIKSLGGKIEVHSKLGEGTEFVIHLPLRQK